MPKITSNDADIMITVIPGEDTAFDVWSILLARPGLTYLLLGEVVIIPKQ